jgi:PAS domain S-box-containing protein
MFFRTGKSEIPQARSNARGAAYVAILAACVFGTAGIGILDYLSGSEIGMSPLYLLSIGVAAWRGGRKTGLLIALLSAAVWLAAELPFAQYSHPGVAYWNGLARFSIFSVVSLLLSHVRVLTDSLQEQVTEKSAALASELDRHQATRHTLRTTEEQFRTLVEGVRDCAIFLLDPAGNIASWNRGAEMLTGYPASSIMGRHFSCLWIKKDQSDGGEAAAEAIERACREGALVTEGWRQRSDGSRFWASTILSVLRGPDGAVQGFSKVLHDVTPRKRLEDALLTKEESELVRLGHELHDVLGQNLTGLALWSKELEDRLAADDRPQAPLAGKISQAACQTVDLARRMARSLCGLDLELSGLAAALEGLAADAADVFGVQCRFECLGSLPADDHIVDLHVYRIAQEAITNAVKHGHSAMIRLSLAAEAGLWVLRIEDDGVGPPEEPTGGGSGLAIMEYRARAVSGHLTFQRRSPRGAVVTCTFPASCHQEPGP